MMEKGFVYIMTNSSMPGLIKVGMSRRVPTARTFDKDLSCTGIPDLFKVQYYAFFNDMIYAEKKVHQKLYEFRYKKEFFKTDVATGIWAIEHSDIPFTKLYSNPEDDKNAEVIAEQNKYAEVRRKLKNIIVQLLSRENRKYSINSKSKITLFIYRKIIAGSICLLILSFIHFAIRNPNNGITKSIINSFVPTLPSQIKSQSKISNKNYTQPSIPVPDYTPASNPVQNNTQPTITYKGNTNSEPKSEQHKIQERFEITLKSGKIIHPEFLQEKNDLICAGKLGATVCFPKDDVINVKKMSENSQ